MSTHSMFHSLDGRLEVNSMVVILLKMLTLGVNSSARRHLQHAV